MAKLSAKQAKFVAEYLIDLNATQAAIRAGYSVKTACSIGQENLTKPDIQSAIQSAQKAREQRTEITQDMVLQRLWEIATANPNDLIEYRRHCCRHCWGIDHGYQWTESEYLAAQNEAEAKGDDSPDCDGGFGYDRKRKPHPECTQCHGDGVGRAHVHDTRELVGPAKLLYAGVKITKDGLEVKMIDQAKCLRDVALHVGLFNSKHDEELKRLEIERRRRDLGIQDGVEAPSSVEVQVIDASRKA